MLHVAEKVQLFKISQYHLLTKFHIAKRKLTVEFVFTEDIQICRQVKPL